MLDLKKPGEPLGKGCSGSGHSKTYQHSVSQSGTGFKPHSCGCFGWEQSWESDAEGLWAMLDLPVHRQECTSVNVYGSAG